MNKENAAPFSAFGGSSLLAAFGILCLVVLAMLSITTVQSDRRQSEAASQAAADFYAADRQAQSIFARLKLGETVEGVETDEKYYRYSCSISENQTLEVELRKAEDSWEVIRWQAVTTMEYREETLPVWEGK